MIFIIRSCQNNIMDNINNNKKMIKIIIILNKNDNK